ncbi:InlB B-repeat-containing protein [uncultured Fibrobacter sp.]|uniref:InlB B-repeat-containing protein n=1 Tax=uncultured Fibrobacter sp. TaxID=261512 RepID=UPI00262B0F71|nr:InlB B-repeat-containing protein [uncultured Fibrobacter sp.]
MLLLTLLATASSWGASIVNLGGYSFTYDNGYYLIQNATDLNNLAAYVNGKGSTSGKSFKQTTNITLSGNFTPIGFEQGSANNTIKFAGKYYGGNYKISGLTINVQDRAWPVGLFGQVSSSAIIEDVYLDAPSISANGSAGGIAGINDGTIQDSKIIGGSVKGLSVGGVAEANTGTISSVKVENVTVTSTASSSSSYTTYAGGIVGLNTTNSSAKITNCEAYLVTIKGAQYTSYTGGIVGKATVGTVQYNFSIRNNVSGYSNYGAIAGIDQTSGTFTGNYYNSMKFNNVEKTSNVAFGSSSNSFKDVSGKGEAVFRVILNVSNVTTSGHAVMSHNPEGSQDNVPYAAVGATVYLNYTNLPSGYTATYTVSGATVTYSSGKAYFTMPSKNVTVSNVTTSLPSYTITYKLNGGTNPSSAPTSYTPNSGTVDLPTPTKSYYSFGGWYTNSSFSGSSVSSFNAASTTGNKTYYAKWTPTAYSITYYLNSGTNPSNAPTSYTYESSTITLPTPTRTGYNFGGWFTNSSLTGSSVNSIPANSSGNKYFYAKWNLNTYYVKFYANDGSSNTKTQLLKYNESSNLLSNTFTPATGYGSFIKWTTNADGSGTSYTDGQRVSNLTNVNNATVNLYAQWKIDLATNSNITVNEIPDQAYTGNAITPSITVKDGTTDITSSCNISYSNNTAAGIATVTISAKTGTKYEGTKTVSFTILGEKKNIANNPDITITIDDLEYTGDVLEPAVTVMDGSTDVTSHFNFTYSDNINIGVATVTISAKSTSTLYKGSTTKTFNIVAPKKNIATNADITINEIADQAWKNGNPVTPKITVLDGETDITSHFDITYSNNTAIGEATVTISAKSTSTLYKGSTTRTFNIIEVQFVAPEAKDLTYNGKEQELVTAGTSANGILYSTNGANFTSSIPTGYSAGTYSVYYKEMNGNAILGAITVEIKKAVPNVILPVAKTLSYTGEKQELLIAGSTDVGMLQYEYKWSGVNYKQYFGENIPNARNSGTYTIHYYIEETSNYYGFDGGEIEVTIPGKCTQTAFLSINEVDGKKYAIIESSGNGDAFDLNADIDVDGVKISRGFPVTEGNNYSTIMFPFEVSTENLSGVANIMEFARVGKNQTTGVAQVEVYQVWADTDKEHVTLTANMPYMIQMKSSKLEVSGPVTITSEKHNVVTKGKWSFVGTFKFKEWGGSNCDECGRVYGFAGYGVPSSGISTGQFVKFGEWVYIDPLRAYLRYDGSQQKNAPEPSVYAAPIASIEEDLPESMDVVIVSREDEEKTTVIGTLDTRTGEIRMNRGTRTFDLKGRGISGKPKAKGVYLKK